MRLELNEFIFTYDGTIKHVQYLALVTILDAAFGRQVEVLVELLSFLILHVGIEPI